jgi:DNA-binding transcriptional LysR family regulator
MDFNRLLVFHTVARHLSFSRAADDLYTSQPNISRQIAKLESELGATLFDRVGNRVVLTDAGRLVEEHARRTFELNGDLTRSLNELKGLERGYLRLAAGSTSGSYILPQAIAGFLRQHPRLDVSLHIGNSLSALQRVLQGEADLAFVEGEVEAAAVQVQPYTRDQLLLVAAPDHELVSAASVTAADIGRFAMILREPGSGTRRLAEAAMARWQITPRRVMLINHSEALAQSVMARLGLAFISRLAVAGDADQHLAAIGGDQWRIPYSPVVVSRKGDQPPMSALAFMSHIRKHL